MRKRFISIFVFLPKLMVYAMGKWLSLLFFMVLFSAGCKKESSSSEVTVRFNFTFGTQPLVYNQEYLLEGKTIKLELVKFYVSLPALQKATGEWVSFTDPYHLVDLNQPVMRAGKLPKGDYTALQLGIGVDSTRNIQSDPLAIPATDYPTDHPLNASADMWWGWATGYIFVKLEGRLDANGNGTYSDIEDKAISYHPGVAALYTPLLLNKSFSVSGESTELTIQVDMEKLLFNLDLLNNPFAHPNSVNHPEYPFAQRMMDNFPYAVQ
jgi:hypothetical protein